MCIGLSQQIMRIRETIKRLLCVVSIWCSALMATAVAAEPIPLLNGEDPSSVAALAQRVQFLEARLEQQAAWEEAPAGHRLKVVQPGDFPNSIRIPGTSLSAKVGGFVKGDVIYDFDAIGSTDNFAALTIPTDGRDGENTRLHARQTRLNIDFRWPTELGQAKIFVEGDFFGVASTWRMRHAYAELGPLLVGQTWTTFTHIEALPETIDFESPGAFILTRRGMVRWTSQPTDSMTVAFAIEDPLIKVTNPADLPLVPLTGEAQTPWPDFVGRLRYTNDFCQFQFAGVVRTLGFRPDGEDIESETGYGLNASGVVDISDRHRLTFLTGFGEGVAGLRGRTDGVPTPAGGLELSDVFIGNVGYRVKWSDKWRSTVVYSQGRRNNTFFETDGAFHSTQYIAANLIWTPVKHIDMGVEYLFGTRQDKDGSQGEANRLQFGLHGIRAEKRSEKLKVSRRCLLRPLFCPTYRAKLLFWYGLTIEKQFWGIVNGSTLWRLLMASEATQILQAVSNGNRSHVEKLMQLVYDDLRGLAHAQLCGDTPNHTLDPTALVHEVFIKLIDRKKTDWRGRSHFFAVCAKTMRHILVDCAREKAAQKRGGNRQRIPLTEDVALSPERDEDVLVLDESLNVLAEIDEQRAMIVELRFFSGMTVKEVALVLGTSEKTVGREWAATRLWLRKYLAENPLQNHGTCNS